MLTEPQLIDFKVFWYLKHAIGHALLLPSLTLRVEVSLDFITQDDVTIGAPLVHFAYSFTQPRFLELQKATHNCQNQNALELLLLLVGFFFFFNSCVGSFIFFRCFASASYLIDWIKCPCLLCFYLKVLNIRWFDLNTYILVMFFPYFQCENPTLVIFYIFISNTPSEPY